MEINRHHAILQHILDRNADTADSNFETLNIDCIRAVMAGMDAMWKLSMVDCQERITRPKDASRQGE